MIDVGVAAPTFELPALVDGEHRRVALDDYLGEDVVILAFYPGDFNPACDEESDLDELDLFTMQKDVTVLGVGPDTLYAHEAFADAYGLKIPLLSDTRREVAAQYDVAFEDEAGQDLVERAVFVVDHDGEVAYAWSTRDLQELPETEAIKDAIGETGGDETAFARYRVGHAHYVEGRRAFTSAMNSYSESEWMIAQSDFQRAREEFTEADEHFDSAVRFVDDGLLEAHYLAAEEKATHLWQAADWLAQSASHYSSGEGAEGQRLRDDAERPLEEAKAIAEPVDPDAWPPEEPPERTDPDDSGEPAAFVPEDGEDDGSAALDVDIDEESAEGGAVGATPDDGADTEGDSSRGGDGTAATGPAADAAETGEESDIDDDELAEIEAELAEAPSDDPVDEPPEERRSVIDGPPGDDGDETPSGADETDPATADSGAANGASDPDGGPSEAADESDHGESAAPGTEITDDELAEIGAEIAASESASEANAADDHPDEEGDGEGERAAAGRGEADVGADHQSAETSGESEDDDDEGASDGTDATDGTDASDGADTTDGTNASDGADTTDASEGTAADRPEAGNDTP